MRYISQQIKFNIYLLTSEMESEDYIIIYNMSANPSYDEEVDTVYSVPLVTTDDPSMGDSYLYTTTKKATENGLFEYRYKPVDKYGNEGAASDSFFVDVCLTPVKPTLSSPVYNDGQLTFEIGQ